MDEVGAEKEEETALGALRSVSTNKCATQAPGASAACSGGKENGPDVVSTTSKSDGSTATAARPQRQKAPADKKRAPASMRLEELAQHVRCGVCTGPVACSLVLSCGHQFCGACLCQYLDTQQPCCPVCHMGLRAVPVRCLAVDHVVHMLLPFMGRSEQEGHARRRQEGHSAADVVNKSFWWLAPAAVPVASAPNQGSALSFSCQQPPYPPCMYQQQASLTDQSNQKNQWQGHHRPPSAGSGCHEHQQQQRQQQQQQHQHQHQRQHQHLQHSYSQGSNLRRSSSGGEGRLQPENNGFVAATAAAAAAAATTAAMQHLALNQYPVQHPNVPAHAAAAAAAAYLAAGPPAAAGFVDHAQQQHNMAAAAAAAAAAVLPQQPMEWAGVHCQAMAPNSQQYTGFWHRQLS